MTHTWRMRVLVFALVLLPLAASAQPLPEEVAARFAAIEAEPPPKQLTRKSHYVISNEKAHHQFRHALDGERGGGGVYVGVGTDQNYLLAGWLKPDVLVMLDFDQVVVDLHAVYRLVFERAETPEAMIAWWEDPPKLRAMVSEAVEDQAREKRLLLALRHAKKTVYVRLRNSRGRYKSRGIPMWLTDADQYAFVRQRALDGRIFAVRGDLTGPTTMKSLAQAAKDSGMVVRAIYLSNAEQYFKFGSGYRENIAALPFDARSIVLRTMPWDTDENYAYFVQSGQEMQAWLASPRVSGIWTILKKKRRVDPPRGFVIEGVPAAKKR